MHHLSQVKVVAALLLLLVLASCGDDVTNVQAPGGEPPLGPDDDLPGVVVAIASVTGGSLPNGNARVGDRLVVEFTVRDDAGDAVELGALDRGSVYVSGPTFNYQRVISPQGDLLTAARPLGGGRYEYRFSAPIPAVYLAPYNDADVVEPGELAGQALLAGTYTVGLELRKDYSIGGAQYRDVGNATADFLFGSVIELAPREVVTLANCNQCHGELRAHGGNRNDVVNCLLCHTAGARDRDGEAGPSVDFKVMIHKIHAGRSLPSVVGVATFPDGSRNYATPGKPYTLRGFGTSDFSHVQFPAWPSMTVGMPRDTEWAGLGPAERAKETAILAGPVACDACHGDPDGAGPLAAPAQRELIYAQPSRTACGSCHDDWDPTLPYVANGQPMPPQLDDAACRDCHVVAGTPLAVADAHRHPLTDPEHTRGLAVAITDVTDVGAVSDGRFEAGERVAVTFTVSDRDGAPVTPGSLARIEAVLGGPVENPNLLHLIRIPTDSIGSGPSFTTMLPESVALERVGVSDGQLNTFRTRRPDHRDTTGAETWVFRQDATGAVTSLSAAVVSGQNHLDVVSATGIGPGDVVAIDAGGSLEYVQVRLVEGDRLWLSSRYSPTFGSGSAARPIAPGTRQAHASGASVVRVTLVEVPRARYTLLPASGTILETSEFGDGPVLVSYTADYIVPAAFPGALNASPDLEQSWGDWRGLPLLDGTYHLSIWATRSFAVDVFGEPTNYTEASAAARADLLFGAATAPVTVARLDDAAGCNACHGDLQFHGGGRRGVAACLACHGLAGGEDAPRYVYPAAPATPGVTIDFRTMLHKIHHGRELAAGDDYQVVGFGGVAHSYEHVGFPFMPGGTRNCGSCHGPDNQAWQVPADRVHPAAQLPTRTWRATCGACHDSSPAAAHIDANTSPAGAESCAVCHGEGKDQGVVRMHRAR